MQTFTVSFLLFVIFASSTIIQCHTLAVMGPPAPKTIYLIRHAESNENIIYNAARRTWARLSQLSLPIASDVGGTVMLPFVMFKKDVTDAEVSEHGRKQIEQLRRSFTDDEFMFVAEGDGEKDHLVVAHSPLKRAKQTAYGIIKGADVIDNDEKEGLIPSDQRVTSKEEAQSSVEFTELECLREVNPKEMVRHQNRALDRRISAFEEWIESRTESHMAIVGHSVYFQRMLGLPRPFSNCDVWELTYSPNISEEGKPSPPSQCVDDLECHSPPRSWHSMKLLYRYEPPSISEDIRSEF